MANGLPYAIIAARTALFHDSPPFFHSGLGFFQEAPIFLALEQR
jgi:hypothetical protein